MMDDAPHLTDLGAVSARPRRRPAGPLALRLKLAVVLVALGAVVLGAAELHEETVAAWNRYIEATERRIADELAAGDRFLVLDFRDDPADARRAVLAGEVRIEQMETRDADGRRLPMPKGAVHHWRGSVLIPDTTLEVVLHHLLVEIAPSDLQEDVIASRLLERDGDRQHFFLRIRRRQVVTADYNSELRIAYTRHGPDAASSRSIATRIAELEDAGSSNEREKPIGRDRGLMWRLRTYWRYQQVDEGVIAECETVTLSRGIPRLLGWMVRPLVNRGFREVLNETLTTMSDLLGAAGPLDDAAPRIDRADGP